MLRPHAVVRIYWDLAVFALLGYLAIMMPYRLGFMDSAQIHDDKVQIGLDLFTDFFLN